VESSGLSINYLAVISWTSKINSGHSFGEKTHPLFSKAEVVKNGPGVESNPEFRIFAQIGARSGVVISPKKGIQNRILSLIQFILSK